MEISYIFRKSKNREYFIIAMLVYQRVDFHDVVFDT